MVVPGSLQGPLWSYKSGGFASIKIKLRKIAFVEAQGLIRGICNKNQWLPPEY